MLFYLFNNHIYFFWWHIHWHDIKCNIVCWKLWLTSYCFHIISLFLDFRVSVNRYCYWFSFMILCWCNEAITLLVFVIICSGHALLSSFQIKLHLKTFFARMKSWDKINRLPESPHLSCQNTVFLNILGAINVTTVKDSGPSTQSGFSEVSIAQKLKPGGVLSKCRSSHSRSNTFPDWRVWSRRACPRQRGVCSLCTLVSASGF